MNVKETILELGKKFVEYGAEVDTLQWPPACQGFFFQPIRPKDIKLKNDKFKKNIFIQK